MCILSQTVRKFKKNAKSSTVTFELAGNIRKQTKNRSEMNGCLSWLGCVGEMRVVILMFL